MFKNTQYLWKKYDSLISTSMGLPSWLNPLRVTDGVPDTAHTSLIKLYQSVQAVTKVITLFIMNVYHPPPPYSSACMHTYTHTQHNTHTHERMHTHVQSRKSENT